jgi:hypothetical protein
VLGAGNVNGEDPESPPPYRHSRGAVTLQRTPPLGSDGDTAESAEVEPTGPDVTQRMDNVGGSTGPTIAARPSYRQGGEPSSSPSSGYPPDDSPVHAFGSRQPPRRRMAARRGLRVPGSMTS